MASATSRGHSPLWYRQLSACVHHRRPPTAVGSPREVTVARRQRIAGDAAEAVSLLDDLGAWDHASPALDVVAEGGGAGPEVWCFLEPDVTRPDRELLGAAAELAALLDGSVVAVAPRPVLEDLAMQGADRVAVVPGDEPEQWIDALASAAGASPPWGLLVEGTRLGRTVAATVAARHAWGLTGDAIELDLSPAGRLRAWKLAFGGRSVAPIESSSAVQMKTVRPGVMPARRRRSDRQAPVVELPLGCDHPPRIRTTAVRRDDGDFALTGQARMMIGVGQGVDPTEYGLLEPLQAALGGAPLAATRKVTDKGWLPRSRQVGVTGRSLAPDLYVAIGSSGRYNHVVGFTSAKTVLALNIDPDAEIFHHADVGLIGEAKSWPTWSRHWRFVRAFHPARRCGGSLSQPDEPFSTALGKRWPPPDPAA